MRDFLMFSIGMAVAGVISIASVAYHGPPVPFIEDQVMVIPDHAFGENPIVTMARNVVPEGDVDGRRIMTFEDLAASRAVDDPRCVATEPPIYNAGQRTVTFRLYDGMNDCRLPPGDYLAIAVTEPLNRPGLAPARVTAAFTVE